MDLIEFLLARLAEDEWRASHAEWWRDVPDDLTLQRLLGEVDAKRRIVEQWVDLHAADEWYPAEDHDPADDFTGGIDEVHTGLDIALSTTLRLLALPYADHPDFDEGWRT